MKYLNRRPNMTDGAVSMVKGDNTPIVLNYKNGDDTADLIDSIVELRIRDKPDLNSNVIARMNNVDSPALISATDTSPNITINVDEACVLPAKRYYFDLKLTDSAGNSRTLLINTWDIVNANV